MLKRIGSHVVAALIGAALCLVVLKPKQEPTVTTTASHDTAVTESVTTVTKKPDGDVVIEKKTRRTEERKATETASKPVPKPDYSVGVTARVNNLRERPEMGVVVGKRLFGDVWAEIGTTEQLRDVTLGVRVEF